VPPGRLATWTPHRRAGIPPCIEEEKNITFERWRALITAVENFARQETLGPIYAKWLDERAEELRMVEEVFDLIPVHLDTKRHARWTASYRDPLARAFFCPDTEKARGLFTLRVAVRGGAETPQRGAEGPPRGGRGDSGLLAIAPL
jgi:hypothetical protein